jgi:hypothetical protein
MHCRQTQQQLRPQLGPVQQRVQLVTLPQELLLCWTLHLVLLLPQLNSPLPKLTMMWRQQQQQH